MKMNGLKDLQDKMLAYRAKENISQGELAARCGLTLATVNSIENGRQSPSRLTETKIRLIVDGEENRNESQHQ